MKILTVVFLVSIIVSIKCEVQIAPTVVGGVDTSILDHPYMAGIHINWFGEGFIPFCGGAVISRRSILTAAHCLYANLDRYATAREVQVSVGSSYRDARLGLTYRVLRLIRHPKYFLSYEKIENDLAIVRLIFPLIFTRVILPIPLGKFTINAGDLVMVTGFGWIRDDVFATRMQRVQLRAMTNARCLWLHRDTVPDRVTSEMVCLEGGAGQGVCTGDSGSPLEKDGYLVGITCWTLRPCGSTPSVYTRISEHHKWISDNI